MCAMQNEALDQSRAQQRQNYEYALPVAKRILAELDGKAFSYFTIREAEGYSKTTPTVKLIYDVMTELRGQANPAPVRDQHGGDAREQSLFQTRQNYEEAIPVAMELLAKLDGASCNYFTIREHTGAANTEATTKLIYTAMTERRANPWDEEAQEYTLKEYMD